MHLCNKKVDCVSNPLCLGDERHMRRQVCAEQQVTTCTVSPLQQSSSIAHFNALRLLSDLSTATTICRPAALKLSDSPDKVVGLHVDQLAPPRCPQRTFARPRTSKLLAAVHTVGGLGVCHAIRSDLKNASKCVANSKQSCQQMFSKQ